MPAPYAFLELLCFLSGWGTITSQLLEPKFWPRGSRATHPCSSWGRLCFEIEGPHEGIWGFQRFRGRRTLHSKSKQAALAPDGGVGWGEWVVARLLLSCLRAHLLTWLRRELMVPRVRRVLCLELGT